MKSNSNVTLKTATVLSRGFGSSSGIWWGLLGVTAFSFTTPMTKLVVAEMPALLATSSRSVIAGTLAILVLLITRQSTPSGRQWPRITVVAFGVVLGFPLFTSLALTTASSSHSAAIIALLPAATALTTVLRTGEQPSVMFWLFSAAGSLVVIGFVSISGNHIGFGLQLADVWLVLAVVSAAIGYTEGGLLSRELGSWQTICWALILSLPVMAVITGWMIPAVVQHPPTLSAVAALGYLGVVSMFLGFFAWYRGLALGPMTTVSQTQLIQPVLTCVWSVVMLGEHLTSPIIAGGILVVLLSWGAVRSRNR